MDLLKNKNLIIQLFIEFFKSDNRFDTQFLYRKLVLIDSNKTIKYDFTNDRKRFVNELRNFQKEKGFAFAYQNNNPKSFLHVFAKDSQEYIESNGGIKHRIYINPAPQDRYEVVKEIIKRCETRGIKYHFKFDPENTNRVDSIVIYATDDQLPEYLKVLSDIERSRPDLVRRMQPRSLSTTNHGWWSYGPEKIKNSSLTDEVANTLKNCFKCIMIKRRNSYTVKELEEKPNIMEAMYRRSKVKKNGKEVDKLYGISKDDYNGIIKALYSHSNEICTQVLGVVLNKEDVFNNKTVFVITLGAGYTIEVTTDALFEMITEAGPHFKTQEEVNQTKNEIVDLCEKTLISKGLTDDLPKSLNKEKESNDE